MITTSSACAVMPSSAITSRICSRSTGSPWPEPYCITWVPLVWIIVDSDAAISPSGRSLMLGIPPASETISGRLATANRARTAETRMPLVRCE